MSREVESLGTSWGFPLVDEDGIPAFHFSPPLLPVGERPERGRGTWHLFGNHAVKGVSSGAGAIHLFVRCGPGVAGVAGLPGRERMDGASRLFVVEGGQARVVVETEDQLADRSDAETAVLEWGPFHVERGLSTGRLTVRHRLLAPIGGFPGVVSLVSVENRSEGSRWLALHELWDVYPVVPGEVLDAVPLKERLRSLVKRKGEERLPDNSYLAASVRPEGRGLRVELSLAGGAGRKGSVLLALPGGFGVSAIPLSGDVDVVGGEVPVALRAVWAAVETGGLCRVPLCATYRFALKPGERSDAVAVWGMGPAEAVLGELRGLLPVALVRRNEGILWQKRVAVSVEVRSAADAAAESWKAGWNGAQAFAAGWRGLDGSWDLSRLGMDERGFGVQRGLGVAAAGVCASWLWPRVAGEMLAATADEVCAGLAGRMEKWEGDRGFDELLGLAWWAAEHLAVSAAGLEDAAVRDAVMRLVRRCLELSADEGMVGASGLLLRRYAERGAGRRRRDAVESVGASALLCAAFAMLAGQLAGLAAEEGARLVEVAGRMRERLLRLFDGVGFPGHVVSGDRSGRGGEGPHLAWLLLAGLPREMEAAVVEGLEVGRFGSPFAALPFGPAEATAPLCGEALLGNALLVWALAGGQGEAALALQRRLDGLPAGGAVRSGWTAWFLPSWEAGSGGASRLAPVARTLARLKVVSLGPGPGGVMVRPGALREMSVGTPVFQAAASQAGDGVWGQWNPLAGKGCLHLEFGAEEEAGRWSPASGGGILSWRREGTRLRLEVKRGEKWAVQRS